MEHLDENLVQLRNLNTSLALAFFFLIDVVSIKSSNTSTKPIFRFLNWSKFHGVNRLFVLSFENQDDRTVHTKHYLSTAEIKDHNVRINGQNFFNQSVKSDLRTNDNIRKISGCLLDYISKNIKW